MGETHDRYTLHNLVSRTPPSKPTIPKIMNKNATEWTTARNMAIITRNAGRGLYERAGGAFIEFGALETCIDKGRDEDLEFLAAETFEAYVTARDMRDAAEEQMNRLDNIRQVLDAIHESE